MIRIKVKLGKDNINTIKSIKNGVAYSLAPISKIVMRIPNIGIVIENDVPTSYPIKWQFDTANDGVLELQLGLVQDIIDAYINSSSASILTDSDTITGIDSDVIEDLENGMYVDGIGFTTLPQILDIDEDENTVLIDRKATEDISGTFTFFHNIVGDVQVASIYIYNVDYPNGLFWNKIELEIGF